MFFRTVIAGRRYQSFQLLYLLGCRCAFIEMQPVIWQHQLKISIFTVILPLFHKEQSKRFILSTVVCLLHNTVCSYPLLQEDSICLKKSKGIVSILETAIAVAFFSKKVLVCSYSYLRYSCSNFYLNNIVWNAGKHLHPLIF